MAIRIPIIAELEGSGLKKAKAAFTNFKTSVANAEGGMNKFKAGANSALQSVSANAGIFAIGAGIAVSKFAIGAALDFEKVAIKAGEFADKTGLAVEQASKWSTVGAQLNVGSDTIATAIGRINKTDPKKLHDLGVELAYTSDGSRDVNQTFLNVIERLQGIQDPAERARVGFKLMGKAWAAVAPLIMDDSKTIKDRLDAVSKQHIITKAELDQARKFRDTTKELGEKWKDFSITIGQAVLPMLAELMQGILDVVNVFPNLWGWFQKQWHHTYFSDWWKSFNDTIYEVGAAIAENFQSGPVVTFTSALGDNHVALKQLDEQAVDVAQHGLKAVIVAMDHVKTSTDNANAAWLNLIGALQTQVDVDQLSTDIEDLQAKAIAAFGGGEQAVKDFHIAQLKMGEDFGKFIENFPPALKTELTIDIASSDIARLEYAQKLIAFLTKPIGSLGADPSITRRVSNPITGHKASGGPVMANKSYLVGERGPELFTPGTSGGITPNNALGGGGGNTINITVTSADPNAVVRALQSYNRNVGKIPVSVQ